MMNKQKVLMLITSLTVILASCTNDMSKRQIIRLDGEWKIAKTEGALPASNFSSVVPVPGLVDLAVPAIDTVGTRYLDGWYWHKRTFDLANTDFEKIELKIHKAKYHTKVYINGKFAGENFYCFTPSYFDIKPFLLPAGQANEIVIGIGCKSQLPPDIPSGHDNEKLVYIPGIYDHVEITLSNNPFIRNIQCAPDIKNEKLRVVAEIETQSQNVKLSYQVKEVTSGKIVASKSFKPDLKQADGIMKADFEISIKGAQLWSPDSPFLYELALSTGADDKHTTFGMRSFRFDTEKKVALLNDKPLFLRGTNICIYRFFEDPDRGTLPWEAQWPITVHERFKDMHWRIARYCIGFPPERWYEICDSIGFMVQDEYPYWGEQRLKPAVLAPQIAEEYRRWMRERWNHPSVVIWDAQNESTTHETGKAIAMVRDLDLSGRPWENGYGLPGVKDDPVETHPYLYSRYRGRDVVEPEEGFKKEFYGTGLYPPRDFRSRLMTDANAVITNPWIINEYGWIWLNRDGTTTTLTDRVYDVLFDGKNLSSPQRLEIYGRRLAEMTEFWRAHRNATGLAGILHFCGLGYSRSEEPRGQTSDHFIDIRRLTYEPNFYKYVKPAFAPVGLMIDIWEKTYAKGDKINVPVFVINDLEQPFNQEVQLSIVNAGRVVSTYKKMVNVKPYEVLIAPFDVTVPDVAGEYLMRAEYTLNGDNVFSLRDIPVK